MVNVMELRQKAKKKADQARALHEAAKKESRALKPDEQKQYDELIAGVGDLHAEIRREEELQAAEMGCPAPRDLRESEVALQRGSKPEHYGYRLSGFQSEHRNLGELARDIRWPEGRENRVLSMGVGGAGGFLVPDRLVGEVFMRDLGSSIVRPRATILPPESDMPDSACEVPTLDYSAGTVGGLVVHWIGEGALKPESEPSLAMVKLEPQEVAAHTVVTDKLLRNRPGVAGAYLNRTMSEAMRIEEDFQCLCGDGVAKPLGVMNSPARIDIARGGAGTIIYNDLVRMLAALTPESLGRPSTCWVCTQDAATQIFGMVDPGGSGTLLIRPAELRPGQAITLLGVPILFSGRTPTLGNRGDLMLLDLSYYLVAQGSGPRIEASQHPLFRENRTVVKCWNMLDGNGWLQAPITLENGAVVSPFVILQ